MSVQGDHGTAWRRLVWLLLVGVTALVAKPLSAAPLRVKSQPAAADRDQPSGDRGPGEDDAEGDEPANGLRGYTIGLGLAALLTVLSFGLPATGLVWGPAVAVALIVLAIAQMGVHLVFFLHLTTGPDNTNNAMALAFGCLIVLLLIGGSLWIMNNLNHNMIGMDHTMQM